MHAHAGLYPCTRLNCIRPCSCPHLQPNSCPCVQQPAKVASKLQEDFKLTSADTLGTVRKLGAGDRHLPPTHAYGVTSLLNGKREPGVDVLLTGGYSKEQQQPDADLGKSLREGWRNIAPEGRTFGVPSVRGQSAQGNAWQWACDACYTHAIERDHRMWCMLHACHRTRSSHVVHAIRMP